MTDLQIATLLNDTLVSLGYVDNSEYFIDTTDSTTIADGIAKIAVLPELQKNAILEFINKVYVTRNFSAMFSAKDNDTRAFLVDATDEGFGIQDIFHEILTGVEPLWDGTGDANTEAILADLYGRETDKLKTSFHITPFKKHFKTTVDERNNRKVFTTERAGKFALTKIANLSNSAEIYVKENVILNIFKTMVDNSALVFNTGNTINTLNGLKNMTEKLRSYAKGFRQPNTIYNKLGVKNLSQSDDDIFIITTPENLERIRVQGYANAFNIQDFELKNQIIYAPNGYDLGEHPNGEKVLFGLVDKRAIVCGIVRWRGYSKFIDNGLYMNHFLDIEGFTGYNEFFNAVAFTGAELGEFSDGVTPSENKVIVICSDCTIDGETPIDDNEEGSRMYLLEPNTDYEAIADDSEYTEWHASDWKQSSITIINGGFNTSTYKYIGIEVNM